MFKKVESAFRTAWIGLAPLVALVSLVVAVNAVSARPPLAVGLTSFQAFPLNNAVRLEWHTETEVNTVAYILKRSVDSGAPVWLEHLGDSGYILADGGPAMAANYVVTDGTVTNGTLYRYFLYEIESNSSEVLLDSLTVTAGVPTATPTSTATHSPTPITIVVNPGAGPTNPPSFGAAPTRTPTQNSESPPPSLPTATATARRATTTPTRTSPALVGTAAPTLISAAPALDTPAAEQNLITPDSGERPADSRGVENVDGEAVPGVALAQAQATDEGAYPPPQLPTSEDASPYPAPSLPTSSEGRTPYPSVGDGSPTGAMPVVGDRSVPTTTDTTGAEDQDQAGSGRIVLWAGFILASVIFAGSVIGSIKLFTRNRK